MKKKIGGNDPRLLAGFQATTALLDNMKATHGSHSAEFDEVSFLFERWKREGFLEEKLVTELSLSEILGMFDGLRYERGNEDHRWSTPYQEEAIGFSMQMGNIRT